MLVENQFGKVGTGWWHFNERKLGRNHYDTMRNEDYLLGIMVPSLADNGPSVKMILQKNKQQSKHNNEGGGLKMENSVI